MEDTRDTNDSKNFDKTDESFKKFDKQVWIKDALLRRFFIALIDKISLLWAVSGFLETKKK